MALSCIVFDCDGRSEKTVMAEESKTGLKAGVSFYRLPGQIIYCMLYK